MSARPPHTGFSKLQRFKPWILPGVVFITGACVLVIEVVATRILAPYFGNTIFSYSSIIGVVLAALSLGYYFGGRLADSRPSSQLFYTLIAGGGLAVVLLQCLAITILPLLGEHLSLISGPLISSLVLFLLPALLLGTLSPFAIKLQQSYAPNKGIGTITGEMFFWSTLGSIAGSLLTGFVLVPLWGVDRIVLGVGLVLVALGVAPLSLILSKRLRITAVLALAIAFALNLFAPLLAQPIDAPGKLVYHDDGVYERITIFDDQFNGRPTRFFMQDRSHSGAMYLDSDELAFDYTKYYSLYKLTKPDMRQALVIGGGAYSIPKALLQELPNAHVDVSEIEPSLHELSQKYFRVPQTDRLTNYTEDGRRLLAKHNKTYDLIFSDVYYSLYSIPAHFTTKEFFQLAHDRLNDDGIFVANLIGSLSDQDVSLTFSEMRTFQQAFPNSHFFATRSAGSSNMQNIIFVGYKSDKPLDLTAPSIVNSDNPIIANLAQAQIDPKRFDLSRHPILTDNYAPIEHLMMPLLAAEDTGNSAGEEMMSSIRQQLSFGGRYSGGSGHAKIIKYLEAESRTISRDVVVQRWQEHDQNGRKYDLANVILRLEPDNPRRILVGAHFDNKATANLDAAKPKAVVPGANDSASGVAALLATARSLAASEQKLSVGVDFVFFDGEEGLPSSGVESHDWETLGSKYFTHNLQEFYPHTKPQSGVILDMVCDKNLTFYQEPASLRQAPAEVAKFWQIGKRIAPGVFQPTNDVEIQDDHTSLNQAGIPSFLVIDLTYPPFHTRGDTIDKCSPDSLTTAARTLTTYLLESR